MPLFLAGLLLGIGLSGIVAGVVAWFAYQRFVRLERRTLNAERLAELGTLTGGLAHEIKNPLSTVQLNLQLLQEDLSPDNPAYQRIISRLSTVRQETGRLRDILDDFLRYAGRIELTRQPVELNHLLEELVDFFTPQAQLHRVQLRLNRAPESVTAAVDAKLVKQAVLNLMLNALQAMPNGGELILSLGSFDHEATIDVIDTGSGISPDAVEKIFQAYYSTKKGGTGLGLAMAKRIAEEHGGHLSVQSEVGKGSDFKLHLPA
ncbi:MAG TPA: ATP-binding protein [Tepidisphaeraceae bacterium]|jgi:signal transduction histidine kinase|nr:ATP-binding protein [Tepidisphaeraceae bacterium]